MLVHLTKKGTRGARRPEITARTYSAQRRAPKEKNSRSAIGTL
jgi:hypothetical protein